MVDRAARNAALAFLERARAGTITNWDFEDRWPRSADHGVTAIGSRLWCFYSDFPRQALTLDQFEGGERAILERCMTFLRGDSEYRYRRPPPD